MLQQSLVLTFSYNSRAKHNDVTEIIDARTPRFGFEMIQLKWKTGLYVKNTYQNSANFCYRNGQFQCLTKF